MLGSEEKATKVIGWIIALSLLAYFAFIPFSINRQKPSKITPQEITTSTIYFFQTTSFENFYVNPTSFLPY